jgi:hypothetical membrane protein
MGGEAGHGEAIRRLALASIAGQAAWMVLIVLAGLIEPGYSEVRDAVSVLGAEDAARPWLFNTAVAIWGCSFLFAAAALALDSRRSWRGWLGPGLIAFTGLAQILDGFPFQADCRWSIDATCRAREMAGELSWHHYAHGITYFLGAIALLASVFAMAWRFRGDPRWGRADLLAIGSGVFGIAVFGVLFFAIGNEVNGQYGMVQRIALAAGGIWVLALTVALLAIHGRPGEPAYRFVAWAGGLLGNDLAPTPGAGAGASEVR